MIKRRKRRFNRVVGRMLWFTRADEDRLCEEIEKLYPGMVVIGDNRSLVEPNLPIGRRITDFRAGMWRIGEVEAMARVKIMAPLRRREYRTREGNRVKAEAIYGRKVKLEDSPLLLRFDRSLDNDGWSHPSDPSEPRVRTRDRGPDELTIGCQPNESHGLTLGCLQIPFDSDGRYVEAQTIWRRAIYRILRKMTSNRLLEFQLELYRLTGRQTRVVAQEPCAKGSPYWYGQDAARWALEDERRFFTPSDILPVLPTRIYRPLEG